MRSMPRAIVATPASPNGFGSPNCAVEALEQVVAKGNCLGSGSAGERISLNAIAELAEVDLTDLGIPLGERKRLLKAIAALPAGNGITSTTARPSAEPVPAQPSEALRRQLTVMFCALVGCTALHHHCTARALSFARRLRRGRARGA